MTVSIGCVATCGQSPQQKKYACSHTELGINASNQLEARLPFSLPASTVECALSIATDPSHLWLAQNTKCGVLASRALASIANESPEGSAPSQCRQHRLVERSVRVRVFQSSQHDIRRLRCTPHTIGHARAGSSPHAGVALTALTAPDAAPSPKTTPGDRALSGASPRDLPTQPTNRVRT